MTSKPNFVFNRQIESSSRIHGLPNDLNDKGRKHLKAKYIKA